MKINLKQVLDQVINSEFPKGNSYGKYEIVIPSLETMGDELYIPVKIKPRNEKSEFEPIKYHVICYKGIEFYILGNYYSFTPGENVTEFLRPYKQLQIMNLKSAETYMVRYKKLYSKSALEEVMHYIGYANI